MKNKYLEYYLTFIFEVSIAPNNTDVGGFQYCIYYSYNQ